MAAPSAGAVVLVRFPFSDLTASKLRPAVALAAADRGDMILCRSGTTVRKPSRVRSARGDDELLWRSMLLGVKTTSGLRHGRRAWRRSRWKYWAAVDGWATWMLSGYSRDFPEALVLWEAQFGDFANGAQVSFPGNLDFLRAHGVEVRLLQDEACRELMARFIRERPELWDEDIAGRTEV